MFERMKFITALTLIAIAVPAAAADNGQWSNLRDLHKGDRIGVVQANQKRIEGTFDSSTDFVMTVQADAAITVEKENVVRVYRRPRINRWTRIAIGAGAGLAAGAILSQTAGARFTNEGHSDYAGPMIGGGAAIGAGIGALTGGGYKTVYQRPAR